MKTLKTHFISIIYPMTLGEETISSLCNKTNINKNDRHLFNN